MPRDSKTATGKTSGEAKRASPKAKVTKATAKRAAKVVKNARDWSTKSTAWKKGGREWERVLGHFGSK